MLRNFHSYLHHTFTRFGDKSIDCVCGDFEFNTIGQRTLRLARLKEWRIHFDPPDNSTGEADARIGRFATAVEDVAVCCGI